MNQRPSVAIEVPANLGQLLDHEPMPWSDTLVMLLCRWLIATGKPLPGPRPLAARAGWSKSRAARWIAKSISADSGTLAGQERDRSGTLEPQQTPNMPRERDTSGTGAGQERDTRSRLVLRAPADAPAPDARAPVVSLSVGKANGCSTAPVLPDENVTTTSVIKEKIQKEKRAGGPLGSVSDLWVSEIAPALGKGARRIKAQGPTGKAIAARIREYGLETVVKVLRWWAFSDHKRARFLRDDGYALLTLVRPSNFEQYAEMADGPATARAPLPGELPDEHPPDWTPQILDIDIPEHF